MLALLAVLTVTLAPGATSFALGDEIPLTFVITNTGTAPYDYTSRSYDHSGRIGEFELIATRADGVRLVDPRTLSRRGYIGGGLGTPRTLAPGESFKQTIVLNLWALLDVSGTYTVLGRYHSSVGSLASAPVTITVMPRSPEEMGRYVGRLGAALKAAAGSEARQGLVRKLAFTRDARAVAFILDATALGSNEAFWAHEAFAHYLPKTAAVRDEVLAFARAKGLETLTVWMLDDVGVPEDEIRTVIAASFEPARRPAWLNAALGAQRYPDDRFMPQLIAIAALEGNPARDSAIYALAMNRTDAGVEMMKRLLADPDPRVRQLMATAIRAAYQPGASATGRPLRPEDFPDLRK